MKLFSPLLYFSARSVTSYLPAIPSFHKYPFLSASMANKTVKKQINNAFRLG